MPTTIHGTNGITFNDGSTQNTRPAVGFRNRIINGDMRIWQRGTTISNPNSTNFYTADRWGCNRASDVSGAVISRIPAALTGFQYALASQRVAGNTGTESVSLWYSFESSDVYDLAGSPITLSYWAKTGTTFSGGTGMFVAIYYGTGTDQRIYNMTGITLVNSTSQTIASTWSRYTLTGTVPANATQIGFQLTWAPTGTAGADDSIKLTGVQLEAGSNASDFERRPIGTELALCQRYYQKTYELGTAPATVTTVGAINYVATGTYQDLNDRLMVEMRGVPSTVQIFNPHTGTAGQVRNYSNSTNYAATINGGAGQTSSKQTMFRTSVPATGANELTYHLTIDAEL
jgi:hypothetical protein